MHLTDYLFSATSEKLQQIQQVTQNDDTMEFLKQTVICEWSQTVQELLKEFQAYWTFREDMTVEDELILKVTRILIPPGIRESALGQLHGGI